MDTSAGVIRQGNADSTALTHGVPSTKILQKISGAHGIFREYPGVSPHRFSGIRIKEKPGNHLISRALPRYVPKGI